MPGVVDRARPAGRDGERRLGQLADGRAGDPLARRGLAADDLGVVRLAVEDHGAPRALAAAAALRAGREVELRPGSLAVARIVTTSIGASSSR